METPKDGPSGRAKVSEAAHQHGSTANGSLTSSSSAQLWRTSPERPQLPLHALPPPSTCHPPPPTTTTTTIALPQLPPPPPLHCLFLTAGQLTRPQFIQKAAPATPPLILPSLSSPQPLPLSLPPLRGASLPSAHVSSQASQGSPHPNPHSIIH